MDLLREEKREAASRMQSVNNHAFSMFMACINREGIPGSEEKARELISRCHMTAQVMFDYLKEQFDPFEV